jgi:tRNA(Ile)-lysidine synthase
VLLARVCAFVERHSLLAPHQTLVVGVSGGPDSITLLHLLTQLRSDYNLNLIAAHLDHGLRPGSARDADFVARTARAWGAECVVERVDVNALAGREGLSLEEAGRKARYAMFARLAPRAAVAHHAGDQAETFLMHLLRGAGPAGMRGMRPVSHQQSAVGGQLTVIRPMLEVTRTEIEAYLSENGLESVADPTNTDTAFFRNRIRHELIPLLETYNPNIRQTLLRTAEVIAGDYDLLRGLVEQAWNDTLAGPDTPSGRAAARAEAMGVSAGLPAGTVAFDLRRWRRLPLALRRALLRESVARLRPHLRDVDFTPIDEAARWSQVAESGRTADLLGGLCVAIVGNELRVGEWKNASDQLSVISDLSPTMLVVPGETVFAAYRFTAAIDDSVSMDSVRSSPDSRTAYLDPGLGPFTLRARRAGDRFQPLGMRGTIKLSDFMINEKIPVDRRDSWPLLCCGSRVETVLWVAGVRLAEQARVGQGATRMVVVRVDNE